MNFKEFLNEARKQPEAYNFEKIKKELIDVVMPLRKYLRDNYKDKYIPMDKEEIVLSDYKSAYYIELYATLKDQGMRKPSYKYTPKSVFPQETKRTHVEWAVDSELRELLQHCMKEAKKIFKKYGLVQDKETMNPNAAARTVKRGEDLEVEFYIGWVKPKP